MTSNVVHMFGRMSGPGDAPTSPVPAEPEWRSNMADGTPEPEWRHVPDFPLYEVSTDGRMRSWHPRWKNLPREMNPAVDVRTGYRVVTLHRDGVKVSRLVHQLVMVAFVGPRPEGMEVRHLDGDALNNRLSNLRYGTKSENREDSVRHGTHAEVKVTHCPRGHAYSGDNIYWKSGREGRPRTRTCRICRKMLKAAWDERQRELRRSQGEAA